MNEHILSALRGAGFVPERVSGRIRVTGRDRLDLLHRISTNELLGLLPGESRGTVFVTEKGRVVDAATVAVLEDGVELLCSPGREKEVVGWLEKFIITEDFMWQVLSDFSAGFCIVGLQALDTISDWVGSDIRADQAFTVLLSGVAVDIVAVPPPLGPIVHVFADLNDAERVGSMLRVRAEKLNSPVLDHLQFEACRILAGIPGPSGELAMDHTPYEAGLTGLISFTKGCYVGQEVIARLDTYGKVRSGLVGVLSDGPQIGAGSRQLLAGGGEVGTLTSVSPLAIAGRVPGLAVVRKDRISVGDRVRTPAGTEWTVAKLPHEPWAS